jgi:mevalonate pyrophosphate decarboxylase
MISIVSLLFVQIIFASQQTEEPYNIILKDSQAIFELVENFREPKNIMFSAMMGGSSHVVWVLSILQELTERGHDVTFYTRVESKFKVTIYFIC